MNIGTGLKGANTSFCTILGIVVVRYIILPILGILVIKGATQLGLVQPDPLYQFVLLLEYALPPAMAIGIIISSNIYFIIVSDGSCKTHTTCLFNNVLTLFRNHCPVVWSR